MTSQDSTARTQDRALRDHVLESRWVEQRPGSRALRITPNGAAGIEETFGLVIEAG
jgi:hypothetical protein